MKNFFQMKNFYICKNVYRNITNAWGLKKNFKRDACIDEIKSSGE